MGTTNYGLRIIKQNQHRGTVLDQSLDTTIAVATTFDALRILIKDMSSGAIVIKEGASYQVYLLDFTPAATALKMSTLDLATKG